MQYCEYDPQYIVKVAKCKKYNKFKDFAFNT